MRPTLRYHVVLLVVMCVCDLFALAFMSGVTDKDKRHLSPMATSGNELDKQIDTSMQCE